MVAGWSRPVSALMMFPLGVAPTHLDSSMILLGRLGALVGAVGLGANLFAMWQTTSNRWWHLVCTLLVLKIGAQLAPTLLPTDTWLGHHNLEILYLHVTLLGVVTIGLTSVTRQLTELITGIPLDMLSLSIVAMLVALPTLTPIWPRALMLFDRFFIVAVLSIPPVIATAYLLWSSSKIQEFRRLWNLHFKSSATTHTSSPKAHTATISPFLLPMTNSQSNQFAPPTRK